MAKDNERKQALAPEIRINLWIVFATSKIDLGLHAKLRLGLVFGYD